MLILFFIIKLKSSCGSVEHTGDNRTGAGDGDDESIKVNLVNVPANVSAFSCNGDDS
jgi:tellurium resistance protein TerD